jgi:hypothetical protein
MPRVKPCWRTLTPSPYSRLSDNRLAMPVKMLNETHHNYAGKLIH